jgi:hypothetical protein
MAGDISVPGAYSNVDVSFTAAGGTAAKILVDETPAGGGTNNFLANTALAGGCRIVDSTVASTDAADKDLIVYDGTRLTTVSTGATGVVTITTQNTINRPAGSWIADGWRVGATVMPFAALNAVPQASDGVAGVVTSVTASTLVVNGTPFTNETLNVGTRLVRASQQFRTTIKANSGNSPTIINVSLIANSMDSTADKLGIWLGATGMKIVAPAAAVSALPAVINVNAKLAGY